MLPEVLLAVYRLEYRQGNTWRVVPKTHEVQTCSGRLPQATHNQCRVQYRVQVGGTRGNAIYD